LHFQILKLNLLVIFYILRSCVFHFLKTPAIGKGHRFVLLFLLLPIFKAINPATVLLVLVVAVLDVRELLGNEAVDGSVSLVFGIGVLHRRWDLLFLANRHLALGLPQRPLRMQLLVRETIVLLFLVLRLIDDTTQEDLHFGRYGRIVVIAGLCGRISESLLPASILLLLSLVALLRGERIDRKSQARSLAMIVVGDHIAIQLLDQDLAEVEFAPFRSKRHIYILRFAEVVVERGLRYLHACGFDCHLELPLKELHEYLNLSLIGLGQHEDEEVE